MGRAERPPPCEDIMVIRQRSERTYERCRERALRGVTFGLSYSNSMAVARLAATLAVNITSRTHKNNHGSYREPTSTLQYHRQQTEVRGPLSDAVSERALRRVTFSRSYYDSTTVPRPAATLAVDTISRKHPNRHGSFRGSAVMRWYPQ